MTGFITSLSELVALIFNSFRFPSLLPALAFSVANGLVIFPIVEKTIIAQTYFPTLKTDQVLVLALMTALVAYFLNALNLPIIRFFEGYPFVDSGIGLGNFFLKLHQDHFLDLRDRSIELEKMSVHKFNEVNTTDPIEIKYQREWSQILTKRAFHYPSNVGRVAPTRLGNVIASAEDQPYYLYKMDTVVLWPLLIPLLTKEGFSKFVQEEKGYFDFLLNSLVIVACLGLEIIGIETYQQVGEFISSGVYQLMNWVRIGLEMIAFSIACWLLYQLSIQGAMGWGLSIRTAFHLYRHKLHQELKLKNYDDIYAERAVWERASDFYRGPKGQDDGYKLFEYETQDVKKPKKKFLWL